MVDVLKSLIGVAVVISCWLSIPDGLALQILYRLDGSDSTQMTGAYSEWGFSRIAVGMSKSDVVSLVGSPFEVVVLRDQETPICCSCNFDLPPVDKEPPRLVSADERDAICRLESLPSRWRYTWPRGGNGNYLEREVEFDPAWRVTRVYRGYWVD